MADIGRGEGFGDLNTPLGSTKIMDCPNCSRGDVLMLAGSVVPKKGGPVQGQCEFCGWQYHASLDSPQNNTAPR